MDVRRSSLPIAVPPKPLARIAPIGPLALGSLSLALVAWVASCASVRVTTDYDTSYDFGRLRDFTWLPVEPQPEPVEGEEILDGLLAKRIRNAVEHQLAAKGFEQTQAEPDFFVHWHAAVKSKIDVRSYPSGGVGYPGGYWHGGHGGWWGGSYIDVRQYDEGTLVVDVIDPASRTLVWRGTGARVVREISDPDKRTRIIDEAVMKILSGFPPKKQG